MVNIRIGLATDSMNFTPTPVWHANNGYDYAFTNGTPFTEIIEDGTPTISEGYSYGSAPRTNTFKCSASGSMAQIKVLEKYNNIAVYKDNMLVFCGYNPTFSKNIKKGVGLDGRKESYVEASISFDDYSSKLKDVQFSSDESFDLYYTASDSISVCDPSNPSKSLVHLLLGYLDPSHKYTYIFGTIPEILRTTKLSYFAVTWQDKVLNVLKDVLEQAGLAFYVSLMEIHIIDILETLTGTAVNIPNIEESAVRKGRSFIEVTIPEIRMATARVAQNMEVYNSGQMTVESKMWAWEDDVFYPKDADYAEGSFTCERKDSKNPNGMDTDEKAKRFFNFQDYHFYGDKSLFTDNGAYLDYFSRTSTGLKYRVRNNSILNRTFQLTQRADVLLFRYADAYRPTDVWSGEKKDCDYIFSTEMAQRYANTLMSQKRTEATYYEFYADVVPSYPNGYPINTVVTLQGTDEENPLLLIVSKTDKFDQFGGYVYKAVPYNRSGVAVSPLYVTSKETLPPPDYSFTASLSRDVIDCYSNRTPKDTTPIRLTVNIPNRLVTPVLTVAGTTTAMTREQVLVSGEYTDTDNWICDIDANLNGYDTCQLVLNVAGVEWTATISKNVPTDGMVPEVIVPVGYTLVTQYCYGSKDAPEPRWVADASYDLEDAEDLVSDIYWVDEIDGQCPLRPRNGYYIWMRQGTYDPETQTEPSTWTVSMYDTPYIRFDFRVSSGSYIKNDRSVAVNDNVIYIYPEVFGYDMTSLVVSSTNKGILPYDSENRRYTLTFNRRGAPADGVTVTATLGVMVWSVLLTCDDQTELGLNLGAISAFPQDYIPIEGDYFVASSDFDSFTATAPYLYEGNTWTPMAVNQQNAQKLLDLVSSATASGMTINRDNGLWTWCHNFVAQDAVIGNLVAQEAFIEQLKGKSALFEDIRITGDSILEGQISNDAFETFGASSPATYTGTFSTSIQTGTIKPNATSSTGDYCKAYCVPRSEIISVFGSNELTKVACTGTAVIDGVTYTGTVENPIYITLQFHWYTNKLTLKIQYGKTVKSWSEEDPYFDFPNGYCSSAIVPESSTPTSGNLASVDLTSISSLGGAYTHDLLAKSHLVDSLGSDGIRYKDVFAGTSKFLGIQIVAVAENAQGYSRLPNGLILKWGVAKTTYGSILRHTIPLTEPFPNTLEFFQVFPIGGSYTENGMEWMYSNTGQLRIGKMYDRLGNELTSGQRVFFIALGT